MELETFRARRERERQMAGYILQWGAGVGAGAAAVPLGPVAAYAAGTGAFAGLGIALDTEIHADIKEGNWSGALNHLSYHLPLLGTSHGAWDAWQAGNHLGAAGHAGLFGVELLGVRAAGKVRWGVSRVKAIKLNNSQRKAIRSLEKQVIVHRQKLKNYISNPAKYDNRGFLKNKPTLERERLIQERIDSLQHQINTFEKDIDAIKSGLN